MLRYYIRDIYVVILNLWAYSLFIQKWFQIIKNNCELKTAQNKQNFVFCINLEILDTVFGNFGNTKNKLDLIFFTEALITRALTTNSIKKVILLIIL